jgi:hypothetical protein
VDRWPGVDELRAKENTRRRLTTEGICSGFSKGSSALVQEGHAQSSREVPPLPNPADPHGWHTLEPDEGVQMRRARRINLWHAENGLQIDAIFQDSATTQRGTRAAVHEYRIAATADAAASRLFTISADAQILPYPECSGAAPNAELMVGSPLGELRLTVLSSCAARWAVHMSMTPCAR